MNLFERFTQYLKQLPFIQKNQKQLVAVSGGVDSVVLCDLLYKAGYDFIIAHVNFQLRHTESERDEQFVKALGEQYDKSVLIKKFETGLYAAEKKVSIQVAARELRYQWFNEILDGKTNGSDENNTRLAQPSFLLTAHHANDNIETLLMNFFKGTGIAGLHGILPLQGKICRPLLFAKKEEIVTYASEQNLQFVEDSSNASDKYTRNYFRLQVIPMIHRVYPNVEDNLLHNIERFTEAGMLYKQAIELHKKKLLEVKGNELHIPVLKLKKSTPLSSILYEIIKDFGFTMHHLPDVIQLLDGETGKYVSSPSHRIIRNRQWLIISPAQTIDAANIVIDKADRQVVYAGGSLHFDMLDKEAFSLSADPCLAALDAATITFPLLLRRCKQGDYFYPLGMKKKKKLSRFFIDQKLSKTDKEKVWVLEMNKKIIWVINLRIDDRFKVTESTQQVLKIDSGY